MRAGALSGALLFSMVTAVFVAHLPLGHVDDASRRIDDTRRPPAGVPADGPLFYENRGQVADSIDYYVAGQHAGAAFSTDGFLFALRPPPDADDSVSPAGWAVRLDLVGGRSGVRPAPAGPRQSSASWYRGAPATWVTAAPAYSRIAYVDAWDGVDLTYGVEDGRLGYALVVSPGADPSAIRFQYSGVDAVRLTEDGQLEVTTPLGAFAESRPFAYQDTPLGRQPVNVAFEVEAVPDLGGYVHGFHVGEYDRNRPLVIDPLLLGYGTYLGGSGFDKVYAVTPESSGTVVVSGRTSSPNFPTTAGAFDESFNGSTDAFVAKLNAAGTQLVWSTYLGGSGYDQGFFSVLGSDGAIYVTGQSASPNFPTTSGAYDRSLAGSDDAFAAKLTANGALVYATLLGGSAFESADHIAVDAAGAAYVTGRTASADFPTLAAFQSTFGGGEDAFVSKLSPDGSALVWSTYLGGAAIDRATAIVVDGAGASYVAGLTASADFPVVSAFQQQIGGGTDVFLTRLTANGQPQFSTFLGGVGDDRATGVAVDASGAAHVTGQTASSNFPVQDAFQPTYRSGNDGFVTKLQPSGAALAWSTFLGGTSFEETNNITLDLDGAVYVVGQTASTDFPVAAAYQSTYAGGEDDAFVSRLSPAGALVWSTYLGGSAFDSADGVGIGPDGAAFVAGYTTSADFPTAASPSPLQSVFGGDHDAYVVRLALSDTGAPPILTTNAGLSLSQGATALIQTAHLRASDTDTSPAQVVFTLGAMPQHGSVRLNGAALGSGGTFTQADIDADRVSYRHDGSETTADTFEFVVSDGVHALPSATFHLTIASVDDPPTLPVNTGLTVDEGATAAIGAGHLRAADADSSPSQLSFVVQQVPAHGALRRSGAALAAGGAFAQADIDAGLVTYSHDGSETSADSFTFRLTDGVTTLPAVTVNIVIRPVNDAPTLTTNTGLTVDKSATRTIEASTLRLTDPDDPPAQLTFTVRTAPAHGHLLRQGTMLSVGSTFTQADVDAGRVAYVHDGSSAPTDTFAFTGADAAGASIPQTTYQITVIAVNARPVAANDSYVATSGVRLSVPARGGVLANDHDPDGTALTSVLVTPPAWGTLDLAPNGAFVYEPRAGATGVDSFTYRASDGEAHSDPATVTIAVSPATPCQPRPRVTVSVRPSSGALAVTISTPVGPIREVRFGPTTDALVDVNGQVGRSGAFTVTPTAATGRVEFVVRRQPGASSAHVPLVVVDDCGSWPTFVGGGPTVF